MPIPYSLDLLMIVKSVIRTTYRIYLLLQCAVKDEDKQTMQGIKGCEEVGHECTVFTDEEEAKDPC